MGGAVSAPGIIVHRTADLLAETVSARLVTRLVDLVASGRVASVVLTGGGIADRVHAAVASAPARDAVDWRRVEWWWGDERYLPPGDPDRNETQARQALLDHIEVDPSRVHPMPADDGTSDADTAAEAYARTLAQATSPEDHAVVPSFDVLMLGVGPDGHIASLFPERPALHEEDRPVVGVHGSPKPPPTRITLTFPALNHAREVWFLVSGVEKAKAVRLVLGGSGAMQTPASGVQGTHRTLWLLDRDAASQLPHGLDRIASP